MKSKNPKPLKLPWCQGRNCPCCSAPKQNFISGSKTLSTQKQKWCASYGCDKTELIPSKIIHFKINRTLFLYISGTNESYAWIVCAVFSLLMFIYWRRVGAGDVVWNTLCVFSVSVCLVSFTFVKKRKIQSNKLQNVSCFTQPSFQPLSVCLSVLVLTHSPTIPHWEREREREAESCWALLHWPPGPNMKQMWEGRSPFNEVWAVSWRCSTQQTCV